MTTPVTIIDYGIGNLLSVSRAFEYCGATVTLSSNAKEIVHAERLVLPGVGAFGQAMQSLTTRGLIDPIHEFARSQRPLLGICLGMQLLLDHSVEFGNYPGLGLIAGAVIPIPKTVQQGLTLKIPNIGWCNLHISPAHEHWQGTLLATTQQGASAYFVHSYHAQVNHPQHELARIRYGDTALAAVIYANNVIGCQFHPEKSGTVGLEILKRFMEF